MQNQFFELSSKMLKKRSNKIRTSLYDFKLFINDQEFIFNKALIFCLSEKIFQVVFNDDSIIEFHFNNVLNENIFFSLLSISKGESFQLDLFSKSEILQFFSLIGFNFPLPFDLEDYDDICFFLSFNFSHIQTNLYNKCIKKDTKNFKNIPFPLLGKLSSHSLQLILSDADFMSPSNSFFISAFYSKFRKIFITKFY
jgi:hypothetical protein